MRFTKPSMGLHVLALMGILLTACGAASDANDRVASLGDDGTTISEPSPEAPSDPEEAFALYDACMKEHGIELPERVDGGLAGIDIRVDEFDESESLAGTGLGDIDFEEFQAADEECQTHLSNLDIGFDFTPEQEAALEDANLAFQECMEEHGSELLFAPSPGAGADVDVEDSHETDPQASQGDSGLNEEELQRAHAECMKVFESFPELEGLFGGDDE